MVAIGTIVNDILDAFESRTLPGLPSSISVRPLSVSICVLLQKLEFYGFQDVELQIVRYLNADYTIFLVIMM